MQAKRDKIKKELDALNASVANCEFEILKYRLATSNPFGAPTKKNKSVYLAWQTILEVLRDHPSAEGMSSNEILSAVSIEHSKILPETFRGYLHRFRKAGLIMKKDDRWHLSSVNQQVDEVADE